MDSLSICKAKTKDGEWITGYHYVHYSNKIPLDYIIQATQNSPE